MDVKNKAEELTKVLIHNKELLDKEDTLKMVIEVRLSQWMDEAHREGQEKGNFVRDLSGIQLDFPIGRN